MGYYGLDIDLKIAEVARLCWETDKGGCTGIDTDTKTAPFKTVFVSGIRYFEFFR